MSSTKRLNQRICFILRTSSSSLLLGNSPFCVIQAILKPAQYYYTTQPAGALFPLLQAMRPKGIILRALFEDTIWYEATTPFDGPVRTSWRDSGGLAGHQSVRGGSPGASDNAFDLRWAVRLWRMPGAGVGRGNDPGHERRRALSGSNRTGKGDAPGLLCASAQLSQNPRLITSSRFEKKPPAGK